MPDELLPMLIETDNRKSSDIRQYYSITYTLHRTQVRARRAEEAQGDIVRPSEPNRCNNIPITLTIDSIVYVCVQS